VPVVVEVAPGEQLQRTSKADDVGVSEALVRNVLARLNCYGPRAALPEPYLAEQMAGVKPDVNDDDARRQWETRCHKVAHGVRSARSQRDWAKKLCDEQVRTVGQKAVWVWFLPEADRPGRPL
jgi:hypothetical protein